MAIIAATGGWWGVFALPQRIVGALQARHADPSLGAPPNNNITLRSNSSCSFLVSEIIVTIST